MKAVDLTIHTGLTHKVLTGFIRSEVVRAGFSHAVIGLSGGLDSALACILAAEALGVQNVLAVRMPYHTSSPDSLSDAQKVIDTAGVQSITIPIGAMVDAYVSQIPNITPFRKANLMPRMRMSVLYDQSAVFDGLVIGTGNKTEILLGYTTLYGDSACAINPLGDLYKSQIRQLAQDMDIPQEIIAKPPSADLWEGQTDEDELGYTYAEVDQLLYLYVDQRLSLEECIKAGFADAFVTKVVTRVQHNHFKRTMPPIAKLSNRTIGSDFLYLRDWNS
jgi:NAD+ synthase